MAAHFSLGQLRLDVVSDGYFLQDAGAVFGIVPRTLWEPVIGQPDARNLMRIDLNCLLVRGGGRTLLIDTGAGNKLPPERRASVYPGDYGHLLDNLAAIGVRPTDIDVVINSHLHFDHCGWNTANVHGAAIPTFPNARYYIQRGEWEAALHPNDRTRVTYLSENLVPLQEAGVLELVEGEQQITPEARMLFTPGHTEAHASVALTAGGETALFLGDMVQHCIQLERNAWVSAFDVLPLVSMQTKQRLVEQAIATRALIVSPHIDYPGVGRLVPTERRPRFEPVAAES